MLENLDTIQQAIFRDIQLLLGGKDELNKWMKEKLHLRPSSISRRINGRKIIDLGELLFLVKHFQLSLTNYIDNCPKELTFHLENNKPKSYEEWMKTTDANFTLVCSQPNVVMHYTSTENPIFYHFHFEALTRFKLYIWARTMWELPELKREPFSLNSPLWTAKTEEYRLKMLKTYTMLPSVEIWTPNLMNNNLSQIQYYLEASQFANREDALLLCDELRNMLDLLLEQTENGRKVPINDETNTGSFELYYNEILHTNNTLLFKSDDTKALYATFGNPTTIKTQQNAACDYAEEWFERLKKRSMKLSQYSERARLRLFRQLHDKIDKAEKHFKGII